MCLANSVTQVAHCHSVPPAYDDVIDGWSYCSSVQQPIAISVSDPHML